MTRDRSPGTIFVIGNVNVDFILGPVKPWPRPGTETIFPQSEIRIGGAAGNSALTLQALGARFRILCNMGDDIFGRWLIDSFKPDSRRWPIAPTPTTASACLAHPNGERTFLTSKGHLAVTSSRDVLTLLPKRAKRGDIALLCGGFLSPRLLLDYDELMETLSARGFEIALDTGWPSGGWTKFQRGRVARWIGKCDHILLNEIESTGLSGKQERDIAGAGRWIAMHSKADATIVIKRGPYGALAWNLGQRVEIAAPQVKVVDTTGAGDVFNAGYLFARSRGRGLKESVSAGVRIASHVIATSPRRYGPRHYGPPKSRKLG
jgi:sugar/nucleoside kinase (ribokinase family)